jgi:hypothetical protein
MAKFLAILLVLSGLGTVLVAADVSGAWKLLLDPDLGGVRNTVPCTFTQDGQKLTIICNSDTAAPIFGEINGRRVTFRLKTGSNNEGTVTHTGQLDRKGTTIRGTWHLVNQGQTTRDGRFEARKQ